jgi:hypothetical protein
MFFFGVKFRDVIGCGLLRMRLVYFLSSRGVSSEWAALDFVASRVRCQGLSSCTSSQIALATFVELVHLDF